MKVEIDKYELQYLMEYVNAMKDALRDAPIDFLGTGSNSKAADQEELVWRDKWQNAYINAKDIIETKIK